jgi:DNA polymerase-1
MQNAFKNHEDLHKKTAATMTGKPEAEVVKHERSVAKAGNFGICYGGTEYALQGTFKEMGIRKSLPECAAVVDAVKVTYPGIPEYQRDVVIEAREKGYSETIYGYIRPLDHINSPVESARRSDERRAQNTPIQGSAADIMKDDQNELYDWVGENDLDGHVDQCQQIHDEVIMELDDDPELVKMVDAKTKEIMERLPWEGFPVPMEAEASVGYNWKDKMSVEKWLELKGVS